MSSIRICFALFLCLFLLPLSACLPNGDGLEKLKIQTADGRTVNLRVEIVDTPESRNQGLMFRESLDDDYGMLFVFEREQPISFWMKNTLIPLDMIFIRADGVVHHIHARAIPHDLTPIPSNGPVLGVIEVRGGQAEALGIRPGDIVQHRIFK